MQTERTTAERVLFQLQLMALGLASGRDELANSAYNKIEKLAQELVDAGH